MSTSSKGIRDIRGTRHSILSLNSSNAFPRELAEPKIDRSMGTYM